MSVADAVLNRRTFLKAVGAVAVAAGLGPALDALPLEAADATGPAGAPTPTPTTTDLHQLAFELAYDPDQIFRFVSDQIAYEPYAGALRGPLGTLWSRAGNSVDQALLLAALLKESLIPCRFVIGSIDQTVVSRLLAATVLSVAEARTRIAATVLPPDVGAAWNGSGAWQRSPDVDPLFEKARDQVDAGSRLIQDALTSAGVTLPEPPLTMPSSEQQQHVWVQYAFGATWVDVDTSIPGAAAGTAYGTAVGSPALTLPDAMYHTLTLRITADVVQGSATVNTELLSQTLRSAELAATSITLIHPGTDLLGVESALSGEKHFAPMLLVAGQETLGRPVIVRTGGGVGGAFGGDNSTDGETVAEYLSVDITTPDGVTRSAQRTVFDRISAADRAAGTVDVTALPPIVLTDAGTDHGSVYLPLSGVTAFAVTTSPVPWNYFPVDGTLPGDETMLVSMGAYAWTSLRDLIRLEALGERTTTRYFDDEPSVTLFAGVPTGFAADGHRSVAAWVDILHTHHVPVALSDANAPIPAGIVAGVVDNVAERMLLEGSMSITSDPPSQLSYVSVGGIFELAGQQGIGPVVLKPGSQVALEGASAAAVRGMTSALANGLVVVAPGSAVVVDGTPRIGWWEIDPATGTAHDRMDDGRGDDLVTEAFILIHEIYTWTMCAISVVGAIVALLLKAWNAALIAATIGVGQCILAFAGGPPGGAGH